MDQAAIQQARSFNRIVAERIGALDDRFLGLARPLGESRVLWEIGLGGLDVRALRVRLGLDSGYASRVLHALERQGLITLEASPDDARVRHARLTAAGRRERAALDRRSDAVAWGLLEPLSAGQRTRLVAAMAEVEQLLQASLVRLAVEAPTTPDATRCLTQYFTELNTRFETGFDLEYGMTTARHDLAAPAGALLIARLREQPVGCCGLRFHADEPPDVKRMWVATEARGLGVGRRLLQRAEQLAADAGARIVRLETNKVLQEAIRLYRSAGYREIAPFNDEPYAHHWFEKHLSGAQPPSVTPTPPGR
jgi:DNA-binding MarR family transcriptional regulator/GNAT superfamily N-acetyltransferase